MTRSIAFTLLLATAAGLVACDREVRITTREKPEAGAPGQTYKTVARLDCPDTQGELKRTSAATDGKSCAYNADDQSEVFLRLVNGDAELAAIETELRALVPPPPPKSTAAAEITAGEKDDAHIRLPGLSIDAEGDNAQIRIGGIHIDAKGEQADVNVSSRHGGVAIVANDEGAQIRHTRDNTKGMQRTLIFASDKPAASGYRLVGYEARGPKAGPLVVAEVRTKTERDTDYVFKDMKALVARNAGK